MHARHDPDGPVPRGGPGRPPVRTRAGAGDVRLPVAVGLAALGGVVALGLSDPYRPGRHLVCPLLVLTGLLCPACGSQRAVHSLAHGELAAAWDMNPLLVVLAPVVLVAWARWLLRRVAPDRRGAPRVGSGPARVRALASAGSPWALLVVVLAFGVLRNVPALAPALGP
ncbi:DUF2752 domain-containing protein [Cellulomonas aerilata]|uniref:DUF2752 domain-containing protein n=1 Tax=Cellulomonas aerilata TaxID=515326 RepID=UPI0031D5EC89